MQAQRKHEMNLCTCTDARCIVHLSAADGDENDAGFWQSSARSSDNVNLSYLLSDLHFVKKTS
jgi:hypothetical protein